MIGVNCTYTEQWQGTNWVCSTGNLLFFFSFEVAGFFRDIFHLFRKTDTLLKISPMKSPLFGSILFHSWWTFFCFFALQSMSWWTMYGLLKMLLESLRCILYFSEDMQIRQADVVFLNSNFSDLNDLFILMHNFQTLKKCSLWSQTWDGSVSQS